MIFFLIFASESELIPLRRFTIMINPMANISRRYLLTFALSLCSLLNVVAGEWIRINQLGYLPHSTKVAVMMCEGKPQVKAFEIRDAFTDRVVFSSNEVKPMGPLGNMGATFRLNFSKLTRNGSYYITVGECRSEVFPVNGRVYHGIADFTLNYMRQQRCGWNPFIKDSCHQKDAIIVNHPTKSGQHIDVRGGWHDAADLLQYTSTSANAIYQMMFAYMQNPTAFDDRFKADGPVYATIFGSLKGVSLTTGARAAEAHNYDLFQPGDVVYHDNMSDYSSNEPTMDGTASLTFPFSAYDIEGRSQDGVRDDNNVYEQAGGIIQGNPCEKNITLVFTADEWADGADDIIATLKKNKIKGAFFFTGKFFQLHADVVRRLVADGHYIGSHSYGHLLYSPWENRDSVLVTKQQFMDDMKKSYAMLARFGITQDKAPFFIPPYEYYNSTVCSWARQMGLQIINFTPGTGTNADYTIPSMKNYRSSDALEKRLLDYERAHTLNGHFLMFHFGTSPERIDKFYKRLPKIIKTLRHSGYNFVSLEDMIFRP